MNDNLRQSPQSFGECPLTSSERKGPLLALWSETKIPPERSSTKKSDLPLHVARVMGAPAILCVRGGVSETFAEIFVLIRLINTAWRFTLRHADTGEQVNLGSWREAMWLLAPTMICGGQIPTKWRWGVLPPPNASTDWSPGLAQVGSAEVTRQGKLGHWTVRISERDVLASCLAAGICQRFPTVDDALQFSLRCDPMFSRAEVP
jgi:hypothetical protein